MKKQFFLVFFRLVNVTAARILFIVIFAASFFVAAPSFVQANHCSVPFGATGYFFDNFQSAEYVNHLLVLHFKLQTPYNDGRSWVSNVSFLSDECKRGNMDSFANRVSLTPGLQYFSVRFVSPTHFEIWNDETNTKEWCLGGCSQDVPAYPGYYEIIFDGSIDGGASTLHSSSYRISDTASDPPVKTDTLSAPSNCTPFSTGGDNAYFFDTYERAEYINGFLAYHFRLQTPYNDGRPWGSSLSWYDAECNRLGSFSAGGSLWLLNTNLPPYSRYYSVRFSSATHYNIWNDETNQTVSCFACSVDVPAVADGGQPYAFVSFGGTIDGGASRIQSTPFPVEEGGATQTRDPVIIIPGILGSAEKNNVWVIDPIFHTYDNLIATLAANGYTEGKDLFTFPYDWHVTNKLTALMLRDKINEVKGICACGKVDLVAHSMGGLVARQYIQSSQYQNDVDQLIFLGTPHLGAPKTYLMWEGGESDVRIRDELMKFFLSREAKKAGYANLFDYVRNKPIASVQELLPAYNYLRDKSSDILRIYPNNYPQNIFLENLNAAVATLFDRAKITNIIGSLSTTDTINLIRVVASPNLPLWEHGYPDGFNGISVDNGLERGSGDGTVPLNSSEFITNDLNQLVSEHSALVTDSEGLVFKKLTGHDVSILIHDSHNIPNLKLLIIKILSPIDIQVIAPDGKRIGKDFQTNGEFNEIDGAFYSGFQTDDEYVTIPNLQDGEYKIETRGTGTGSYTVATGYISEGGLVDKDFTAHTIPNLATELNVEVNNANPQTLAVKPTDITPPAIIVSAPQAKDYVRSDILPVNIDIHDVDSGVYSSQIKFDDRIISASTTIDLFFERLGNHSISVNASDFVENAASTTVQFRIIVTPESVISDIERLYTLGLINNRGVKESLIAKINVAVKPGKKINIILAKAFLNELDAQHDKHINDQAYNILQEDITWLINCNNSKRCLQFGRIKVVD